MKTKLRNEMTFRKLIVWMAEEESATKDNAQEKLWKVMQDSYVDFDAEIIATDERITQLSFHCGAGPNPLQILNAIDATIKQEPQTNED